MPSRYAGIALTGPFSSSQSIVVVQVERAGTGRVARVVVVVVVVRIRLGVGCCRGCLGCRALVLPGPSSSSSSPRPRHRPRPRPHSPDRTTARAVPSPRPRRRGRPSPFRGRRSRHGRGGRSGLQQFPETGARRSPSLMNASHSCSTRGGRPRARIRPARGTGLAHVRCSRDPGPRLAAPCRKSLTIDELECKLGNGNQTAPYSTAIGCASGPLAPGLRITLTPALSRSTGPGRTGPGDLHAMRLGTGAARTRGRSGRTPRVGPLDGCLRLFQVEQLFHRVEVRQPAVLALAGAEGADRVVEELVDDPADEVFQVGALGGGDVGELVERPLQFLLRDAVVAAESWSMTGPISRWRCQAANSSTCRATIARAASIASLRWATRVGDDLLQVVDVVQVDVSSSPTAASTSRGTAMSIRNIGR